MSEKMQHIDDKFREAFKDFEALPKPEILGNILGAGFDQSVQQAFSEFEPEVPGRIWEGLQETLPTESDQSVRASFDSFEVLPAAGLWAAIGKELDGEKVAKDFDEQFQAAFSDFVPAPPAYMEENVLGNDFDHAFRRAFANYEIEPSEEVWQKVRPLIPLSLVIKRHLTALSRVAAVIVAMMLFSFLISEYATGLFNNDSIVDVPTKELPQESLVNDKEVSSPTINTVIPDEALVSNTTRPQPVIPIEEDASSAAIDGPTVAQSSEGGRSSRLNSVGFPLPFFGTDKRVVKETLPVIPVTKDEQKRTPGLASSIPSSVLGSKTAQSLALTPKASDINRDLPTATTSVALTGGEFGTSKSNLINTAEDAEVAKMMLGYKGWYATTSMSVYNSWIVNDEIRDVLADNKRPDYVVDIGRSFGIGAGYQLTSNFGIEAEFVNARLSQSYRELTDLGVFNSSEAKADYYYVPVSLKYQTRRLNSMNRRIPMTASVVLGAQYGQLRQHSLRSNREVNADDSFIQHELGILMGADYYLHLHPNTYLTLGARGIAGTNAQDIAFDSGTPYNLQFGVRVGLHYRFANRETKWKHGIN